MMGKMERGKLAFSVIVEEVWLGPETVQESAVDGASSGEVTAGLFSSLMMLAKYI